MLNSHFFSGIYRLDFANGNSAFHIGLPTLPLALKQQSVYRHSNHHVTEPAF
jgi:hypothetical protein